MTMREYDLVERTSGEIKKIITYLLTHQILNKTIPLFQKRDSINFCQNYVHFLFHWHLFHGSNWKHVSIGVQVMAWRITGVCMHHRALIR